MRPAGLIDNRALQRAILVGTFLQFIAVLIAHFSLWIETHAFLFAGIAVSVALGDLTARMLLVRSLISVLTGAVGGVYGQMSADWR